MGLSSISLIHKHILPINARRSEKNLEQSRCTLSRVEQLAVPTLSAAAKKRNGICNGPGRNENAYLAIANISHHVSFRMAAGFASWRYGAPRNPQTLPEIGHHPASTMYGTSFHLHHACSWGVTGSEALAHEVPRLLCWEKATCEAHLHKCKSPACHVRTGH